MPDSRASYAAGGHLGLILSAVAILPLIALGNPAVALLVGGAIALAMDRVPVPQASRFGRYALQAA
ncbi:MAG TPA: hypothetical protein VIS76_14005, partial [Pseudomonadales bacterium]